MTKILSFSTVEILPSLLNKKKTQVILPAWKDETCSGMKVYSATTGKQRKIHKEPCFKIGEKVQIMWKRGSSAKFFCSKCGYSCKKGKTENDNGYITHLCRVDGAYAKTPNFQKRLGTAIITEVFEIEINRWTIQDDDKKAEFRFAVKCFKLNEDLFDGEDLAKQDGFKSAKDMFEYFDKQYDLSQIRKFYVYRWKWDK